MRSRAFPPSAWADLALDEAQAALDYANSAVPATVAFRTAQAQALKDQEVLIGSARYTLRETLVDIALAEGQHIAAQARAAKLATAQSAAHTQIAQRTVRVSERLYELQSTPPDVDLTMLEDYRPFGEYLLGLPGSEFVGLAYPTLADDPYPQHNAPHYQWSSPNQSALPFDLAPLQNALQERVRQLEGAAESARRALSYAVTGVAKRMWPEMATCPAN